MPIYEFHCEKCGKDFEVRRGMEDPPLTVHENYQSDSTVSRCGGQVTQKFSISSLKFVGTGFYETDYKNK